MMKFVYKSRFKEDYTTGIDLKLHDKINGMVIEIKPLGALGAGKRFGTELPVETATVGDILNLCYGKFKKNMEAEEFPVKALPKGLDKTFTSLKSKTSQVEGIIYIDNNTLRIGNERISRATKVKDLIKKGIMKIDDRIEINYVKDLSFKNDSVYVFEYR